ncbi:MAG: hypothetical protein LDL33_03655, partial [Desulfomonile sp.]|nr:hypothetical protein [Desulfomonile sp.]
LGVYGPELYGGYQDATAKFSNAKPPTSQQVPLYKNMYRNKGALIAGTATVPLNPAANLVLRGSYVIPLPYHRLQPRQYGDSSSEEGTVVQGFEETFDGNAQWWNGSGEIAYAIGPVLNVVAGVRYESYDSRRRTRVTYESLTPLPAGDNYLIMSATFPYLGLSGDLRGPTGGIGFYLIASPVALGGIEFRDSMRNLQTGVVDEVTSAGRLRNTILVEGNAEWMLNIMNSNLGFFLRGAKLYSQPNAEYSFDRIHWAGGIKLAVPFGGLFRGL